MNTLYYIKNVLANPEQYLNVKNSDGMFITSWSEDFKSRTMFKEYNEAEHYRNKLTVEPSMRLKVVHEVRLS